MARGPVRGPAQGAGARRHLLLGSSAALALSAARECAPPRRPGSGAPKGGCQRRPGREGLAPTPAGGRCRGRGRAHPVETVSSQVLPGATPGPRGPSARHRPAEPHPPALYLTKLHPPTASAGPGGRPPARSRSRSRPGLTARPPPARTAHRRAGGGGGAAREGAAGVQGAGKEGWRGRAGEGRARRPVERVQAGSRLDRPGPAAAARPAAVVGLRVIARPLAARPFAAAGLEGGTGRGRRRQQQQQQQQQQVRATTGLGDWLLLLDPDRLLDWGLSTAGVVERKVAAGAGGGREGPPARRAGPGRPPGPAALSRCRAGGPSAAGVAEG